MTGWHWLPRKHPARVTPPQPAPGPREPGNPPPGYRERAEQAAKDLIRDPGPPKPRVLYTVRAYDDGTVCIWDGQRQLIYRHRPGDHPPDWDAALRRLTP